MTMKQKLSPKKNVPKTRDVAVKLSKNEVSYVRGMLAAYKNQLELRDGGNALIEREIKKAQKVEKKFISV